MWGAVRVAGDADRARKRMPGRRGPPHLGRGNVFRPGDPGRHGRCARSRGRQGDRLPARSACRRRAGSQGRGGPHGHHPAGARHHDVCHRIIAGGPRGFGIRNAAPRSGHVRRRTAARTGDGGHLGGKGHRPLRDDPHAGRGQPCAFRRIATGWRHRPRRRLRLRPHPGSGGPQPHRRRRDRSAFASDPAQALYASRGRSTGGDGVTVTTIPAGPGRVHRATRSTLPHSLLRRADQAPRPRRTRGRTAGRPRRTTVRDCASTAITSRKTRDGRYAPASTNPTPIQHFS